MLGTCDTPKQKVLVMRTRRAERSRCVFKNPEILTRRLQKHKPEATMTAIPQTHSFQLGGAISLDRMSVYTKPPERKRHWPQSTHTHAVANSTGNSTDKRQGGMSKRYSGTLLRTGADRRHIG